jgi:hypothetical protein
MSYTIVITKIVPKFFKNGGGNFLIYPQEFGTELVILIDIGYLSKVNEKAIGHTGKVGCIVRII